MANKKNVPKTEPVVNATTAEAKLAATSEDHARPTGKPVAPVVPKAGPVVLSLVHKDCRMNAFGVACKIDAAGIVTAASGEPFSAEVVDKFRACKGIAVEE
jgi:hypothetical protein